MALLQEAPLADTFTTIPPSQGCDPSVVSHNSAWRGSFNVTTTLGEPRFARRPAVGQPCTICQHPRRSDADDLLRRGFSFGRTGAAVCVGRTALHRDWTRHGPASGLAPKRDRGGTVLPSEPPTETQDHPDPAHAIQQAGPPTIPGWPSRAAAISPAGMMTFCWCGRRKGRRGHYAVPSCGPRRQDQERRPVGGRCGDPGTAFGLGAEWGRHIPAARANSDIALAIRMKLHHQYGFASEVDVQA